MDISTAGELERNPVLQIIIASTRPGRVGPSVADWIYERAVAHGGFDVELVDLAEVNLPMFDEPRHPRFGEYVHQHTKDWSATIGRGDAFVIVMPEYNYGFNAAIKNAIDYLNAEWRHKPVGVQQFLDDHQRLQANDVMEGAAVAMLDQLLQLTRALRPMREPAAEPAR